MKHTILLLLSATVAAIGQTTIKPLTQANIESAITDDSAFLTALGGTSAGKNIFNGTLDPLARANHTGTQSLTTISDAGTAAGVDTGTTSGTVKLLGPSGNFITSGDFASIGTTGSDAPISTTGNASQIFTEGENSSIYTLGAGSYIETRATLRLNNGTYTTTLSHSPTANRAIAFPDAAGTLALELTSGPVASSGGVSAIADGALSIAKTSGLQTALDARRTYDDSDFFCILVGDSIMAGTTAGGATSGFYLSALLPNESYFSGRATLVNKGVSGRTATQVLSDYTTGANTDAYAYRPGGASNPSSLRAVIILNAGINDYRASANMTTAATNLLSYVAAAQADGFEVWVCLPLPSAEVGTLDYVQRTAFYTYIQNLRTSILPDKIIDFNSLVPSMQFHGGGIGGPYTSDGLHPNNALYSIMAAEINRAAWSDQRLAGMALGTAAFQNTNPFKTESISTAAHSLVVASGDALYYSQSTAAGSSRQWRFGHTQSGFGSIPANGFGMVAYNGSGFENGLCGFRLGGGVIGAAMRLVPQTVATLIATPATNTFATVTDASAFTAGSTVTGGGSVKCMVQYDGAAWKMVLQLY